MRWRITGLIVSSKVAAAAPHRLLLLILKGKKEEEKRLTASNHSPWFIIKYQRYAGGGRGEREREREIIFYLMSTSTFSSFFSYHTGGYIEGDHKKGQEAFLSSFLSKDEKKIHLNWQPDTHTAHPALCPCVYRSSAQLLLRSCLWKINLNNK